MFESGLLGRAVQPPRPERDRLGEPAAARRGDACGGQGRARLKTGRAQGWQHSARGMGDRR
eukprot:823855-Pleurochrysis_carterae.AAC.1